MKFSPVTLEQCLDIRHAILWPHLPREASRVEGDEEAQHFGVVHEEMIVSCLSVFICDASTCQIRKFATLKAYQGQGFGGFLFQSVLERMAKAGITHFHLNARTSATGFYEKFGFISEGETFFKKGIEFVRMVRE
ncbi:GNAT family N-acetyltransferase [Yokenella regensburgei]|uniref:GNAT family N-acetyltransferase n=1 Tax=Yokenella regensburgei TaxID=158877 RepID=UPI003F1504F6